MAKEHFDRVFDVLSRKGNFAVLAKHNSGQVAGADDQVEEIVSGLQRVCLA